MEEYRKERAFKDAYKDIEKMKQTYPVLQKIRVLVLDVGRYSGGNPMEFLEDISQHNPVAINFGWCYSVACDISMLLRLSGKLR